MNDLRTAAQQALEALMDAQRHNYALKHKETDDLITALKAALAEPELNLSDPAVQKRVAAQWGYVKAAPPLTDDEIAQVMYRADAIVTGPMQFRFARAIERAHGIGGEDDR